MKTKCEIDGCERVVRAKGLCSMHYYRKMRGITDTNPGRLEKWASRSTKERFCSLLNCNQSYFAKGYCRNHYDLSRKNGFPGYRDKLPLQKCKAPGCDKIEKVKGFCIFHYSRYLRNVQLNRPWGIEGELNPRWNGGASQYPNHHLLKKNRLIVMERDKHTCFKCGNPTNQVHHKDHKKTNHSITNLVACCQSCNLKIAWSTRPKKRDVKKPKTSKFIRLYGRTIRELTKALNLSVDLVRQSHQKGELQGIVRNEILFRKF